MPENECDEARQLINSLLDENESYFEQFSSYIKRRSLHERDSMYFDVCRFTKGVYDFAPVIIPSGDVYPCMMLMEKEYCMGNLEYLDQNALFSQDNKRLVSLIGLCKERKEKMKSGICSDCIINHHCEKGCIAQSISSGDICGRPDWCETKKRIC